MRKTILLTLVLCSFFLFSFPLISAITNPTQEEFGYNFLEEGKNFNPKTNLSTLNVNDSQFFRGFTPTTLRDTFQTFFNTIYCKLTGCDMEGPINMGGNDLENVGNIEGDGTDSYFNQTLLITGDSPTSKDSNADLWLRAEVNFDACINLTESEVAGISICYDGTGSGIFEIKNFRDGTVYMTIDVRDSGNITFLNDTIFETIQVTTLNITGDLTGYAANLSFIYGANGIGGIDMRGDPWWFSGADFQIVENLIVDGNASANWFKGKFNWTTATDWNSFDGSTLTFNSSKLATIFFNASTIELITGTSEGSIEDLQSYNSIGYNVSEDASDFELRINFTGIEDFNNLIIRYKAELDFEVHDTHIDIWDYGLDDWEHHGDLPSEPEWNTPEFGVFDSGVHIGTGSNEGVVQVRVIQDGGVPPRTHKHEFDWITISLGLGTPAQEEVDPFFNTWLMDPAFNGGENVNGSTVNSTWDWITANNLNITGTSYLGDLVIDAETINSTLANFENITVNHIEENEEGHDIVIDSDMDLGDNTLRVSNFGEIKASNYRVDVGNALVWHLNPSDNSQDLVMENTQPALMPIFEFSTLDLGADPNSLLIEEGNLFRNFYLSGDANIGGDAVASFFNGSGANLFNVNFTEVGLANYQFLDNNFNGSGNFTTSGRIGVGTDSPNAPLEVVGLKPGVVGGFQSGMLQVRGDGTEEDEFYNSVITGHNSFNNNTQLWYLGSPSGSNNDIAFINRKDYDLFFSTNNTRRMTIDNTGKVGINTSSPTHTLNVVGDLNVTGSITSPTIADHPHQDVTTTASPEFDGLDVDNLNINGNSISSTFGQHIRLDSGFGIQMSTQSNEWIILNPDGNGIVEINSDVEINGDLIVEDITGNILTGNSLQIDNININNAVISSNTGQISFDNDNILTTGRGRFDLGVGVGIDPGVTDAFRATKDINGLYRFFVDNNDVGEFASARLNIKAGALRLRQIAYGVGITTTRFGVSLSNAAELLISNGEFFINTATTGKSIYIGTESELAMTIDGSNQNVSIEQDLFVGGRLYVEDGLETNGTIISHSPSIFCGVQEGVCLGIDYKTKAFDWCQKDGNGNWFCDNNTLDIINKLNQVDAKKAIKENCRANGYSWDNECFEIITTIENYNNAVEIVQVNETITINETCFELGINLQVEEYDCPKSIKTGKLIDQIQFKQGCDWNERTGEYYCEERVLRNVGVGN